MIEVDQLKQADTVDYTKHNSFTCLTFSLFPCAAIVNSAAMNIQNWIICRDVDGPRVCHTGQSKSERGNEYCTLMHAYEIQKNGTNEPSSDTWFVCIAVRWLELKRSAGDLDQQS